MRHAAYALLGLMVAFAALMVSGTASQAAMAGDPGATRQTVEKDALVQKVWYHHRHRSHWRWGSYGHGRHRSHWRWGSHGGHWRWGSHGGHGGWGGGYHHGRHRSHWRWGSHW